MKKENIKTFKEYLDIIDNLSDENHEILLFRGQSDDSSLLPSISRKDSKVDTTETEKKMLLELKRRTQLTINIKFNNDWEWLVYAQHFGMKTRLLDWSSNPLTALWFACSNEYMMNIDSYVYIFSADSSFLIDTKIKESPFGNSKTRILRPALNNERIIAQGGWFTAHKFSNKAKCFVKLETNLELKNKIIQIKIPFSIKKDILKRLSVFGINSQSLFPDISGVCNHLNWMYTVK